MTEIRSKSEKYFLTCIYRCPNQSHDEFENFYVNWDLGLNNLNDESPICSIVTGDFNVHCSSWWRNDIARIPGQEIDFLTSWAGYVQTIDKPTHVVNTWCIDLTYCTSNYIISNHVVDVTVFEAQLIFGTSSSSTSSSSLGLE